MREKKLKECEKFQLIMSVDIFMTRVAIHDQRPVLDLSIRHQRSQKSDDSPPRCCVTKRYDHLLRRRQIK